MFSARPSLDALAAPTVAAFWLAPHFGQNAADPSSEPQALQNAIETPPSIGREERNKRPVSTQLLLFAISPGTRAAQVMWPQVCSGHLSHGFACGRNEYVGGIIVAAFVRAAFVPKMFASADIPESDGTESLSDGIVKLL
jgi:hypothetical protein